MKRYIVLLTVLLCSAALASAQTERRIYTSSELERAYKTEKSGTEEEEVDLDAVIDSIKAANAINSLENLSFVLEADKLVLKRGETVFVTPNTNFISLNDDKAVVQVAPRPSGGPNGVGGITLEGTASNITIRTDKRGNHYFRMSVFGSSIQATVDISLPKDGYRASVTITPNLNSNKITLYGEIVPLEFSRVFKGVSAP